ncbi:hypothetical protein, partial [Rothia nasimurium]|uniref:hypothetical protein n=1 Tax=Rothia nasimurium TaxID=85336 RepID=UPI001F2033EB
PTVTVGLAYLPLINNPSSEDLMLHIVFAPCSPFSFVLDLSEVAGKGRDVFLARDEGPLE